MDKEGARRAIEELCKHFQSRQSEYESAGYLESQLRTDFIDELFKNLGWDLANRANLSRLQREVLVEKGDTKGRPDYSFRVDGEDRFFVEAKAPSRGTDKPEDIFQAKRYGWNTRKVTIVVLTDFKTFKVFDVSLKPDLKQPSIGMLFGLELSSFSNQSLEKLWLFSHDEVINGSLDRLISKEPAAKRLRIPVDRAFLEQMTIWRETLAKDIYKRNPDISVHTLNDVVQRLLDRLVFIRILEDRKIIESKTLREIAENWSGARHRDVQPQLNTLFKGLNRDFNGEIFKEGHGCETVVYDSKILAEIIDDLYFPKSPYDFAVMGVELLGIIYEKYLGKTIRLTERRVKVEEKPEVRKAGGVYYTPKWIVKHIVENTIGKLIENMTPAKIDKLKVLDPACGSGSFLIRALERLFEYHLNYYARNPSEAKSGSLFPDLVIDHDEDGNEVPRLSIWKKCDILKSNIYGVDVDPQAVEITMMSLYIKVLEDERLLPHDKELLPPLSNNIRCGNSLIGMDFFEQGKLVADAEREKVNAFEWNSEATGFGAIIKQNGGFDAIIGNPPYVRSILLREEPETWEYYRKNYKTAFKEFDIYLCFLEKGHFLLAPGGRLGFIMPNKWLHAQMGQTAREFFMRERTISSIINFGSFQVFDEVTTYTMLIFLHKKDNTEIQVRNYVGPLEPKPINLGDNASIWQSGSFKYESLSASPWHFITGQAREILSKFESLPRFGSYFTLAQGTGTRADPVFFVRRIEETKSIYRIFSKHTQREHVIEKAFIRPSAKGEDVDSYQIKETSSLLIFPYHGTELVDRKEMQRLSPRLLEYLDQCREALEERENGRWKGSSFYCYGRPQNHGDLPKTKILVPVIVNRAKAAWDSVGLYVIDSVYFVRRTNQSEIDDEYILALLNSNLLTYFLLNTSSNLRGGYFSMKPGYVDPFPLKTKFSTTEEKEKYSQVVQTVRRISSIARATSGAAKRETTVLKERLDQLIYDLYGLTAQERKALEDWIRK